MVKAILAKSGIVSFTRAIRIIKDALIVKGTPHELEKEAIMGELFENSRIVLPTEQSFIALSGLVYPD